MMKYISGIHALNIECNLNTTGDWHRSALKWDVLAMRLKESDNSIFKDYGIEQNKSLLFLKDTPIYNVANHIRACLDLIADGNFASAMGMRNDFICTNEYDYEIFEKVLLLKNQPNWQAIDDFMGQEYQMKWLNFKNAKHLEITNLIWEYNNDLKKHYQIMSDFFKVFEY